MSNPIITENQNTGTSAWNFPLNSFTTIQGYVDKKSYNPGDTVTFFVSTSANGPTYSINIYRMGWYQGTGGCLKGTISGLTGVAQGIWDGTTLTGDSGEIFNSTTHNLEAGWSASTTWSIPSNACTGMYLAVFTNGTSSTGCMFVVKGNSGADYLYVDDCTTDYAYNGWGGYSLYTNPTVDVQVSFNKPHQTHYGTGYTLYFQGPLIHWLEMRGYNLSYTTLLDCCMNPSLLSSCKAFLVAGHSEYWTKEGREGMIAAIASGVSAAFLGADIASWQIRLDNDNAGNPNRTITCYKVTTAASNLANDPHYTTDLPHLTTRPYDPALNYVPAETYVGVGAADDSSSPIGFPWVTDPAMDTRYTAGTGLVANTSYGSVLVGYEWDKTTTHSPANIKIIATSAATDVSSQNVHSETTFYTALSGALVFATGSMQWTWALDSYQFGNTYIPGTNGYVVPQMQILMANVMGALKGPVFSMVGV